MQQFNSYRQLKLSGVGIGGKPMPNFNLSTEMSPIDESAKILMSYASDPDNGYKAGPATVYDDTTRRNSIYRSDIDIEGDDLNQQTQTAFEPFNTTNEYFNATNGAFNKNNLEVKAIPQKNYQFNDKAYEKIKRPVGIDHILRSPSVRRPSLNKTFQVQNERVPPGQVQEKRNSFVGSPLFG